MFSNGTEYENFTSSFCERCKKYIEFPLLEEQVCLVQNRIVIASMTGDERNFPYDDLKALKNSCRYACKKFESDDKELMENYKGMMDE